MENKTIATVIGTTVLAGTLAATLILNPVEQTSTPEPIPTPTATVEVVATPSPSATPNPTPTGTPVVTPAQTATPKPTATVAPTTTPQATQTPRVATLEDYAIRTVLEDGTVIVTYQPDTPQELLDTLIPKKKGAK
jgi:hypothetical protein